MQILTTNICSKCKAFFSIISRERLLLSTDSRSTLTENLNILTDLGLSKDIIDKIAKAGVKKKEPMKPKMTIELFQRLGFDRADILAHPKFFRHSPKVTHHRFKALEEGGFPVEKITIPLLLKSLKLFSTPVYDLKTRGLIGKTISVKGNILSYCDLPSNLYPPELEVEEFCQLKELQVLAIQSYLSWKFDLSLQEIEKLEWDKHFTFKSIRLIMENYTFLTTAVGLSKEMIKQNLYLLSYHPAYYEEFIERLPIIGIQPVHEVAKTFPKLLLRPVEKVLEITETLEEFSISPKSLNSFMDILFLSPKTVRKRLQYLRSDPNFQPFFHHPGICKAVLYFEKITKRFAQLSRTKWRTKTLDMLSLYSAGFQGRLKLGADVSKGDDIVHYLHKELKMKRRKVREMMQQNQYWHCVPLITLTNTLKLLREAGFDSSHISSALPILLYPKEEVSKWLQLVDSQPEVDCCRDPATGKLQTDLVLPLVLYFLERPFHFSGNGIWDIQAESVPDNSLDHTSLIDPTL